MSKQREAPQPTIGRLVHFVRTGAKESSPAAAIVTGVHSGAVVNLRVIDDGPPAGDQWHERVRFEDDVRRINAGGVGFAIAAFWRWPPRL